MIRGELAARGLDVEPEGTQIVPVTVGEAADATALCEAVLARGVFAQAIRPPTVPEGTSRLRLTVIATHREDELRRAAAVIAAAWRKLADRSARLSAAPLERAA